jgi:hypothetical protein
MIKIRFLLAIAVTSLLLVLPQAGQAEDPRSAPPPLKPGRSAGVHAAQQGHTGLALIGGSAIIAVIVIAATTSNGGGGNNQNNSQIAPATTTP